jgi:uracil-DNA glycosylase family 4
MAVAEAAPEYTAVAAAPPAAVATRLDIPQDWDGLKRAVEACRGCRLCEGRTQTVFGTGGRDASLMVVGEGPGADEDAQGDPFVGRAGKLLDEMLRAIGRSRKEPEPEKSVFIVNTVKCRPPANREPSEDEAEACRPFLEQQLKLVKPRLILALGRIAAQRLLVTDAPLTKLRGKVHQWGPDATPLIVTYHPAYLLRSPGEKAKSWEDLKRVHQFLAAAQ